MKSTGKILMLVMIMAGLSGCKTPGPQGGSELRDAASTRAAMQQCNFFLSQKEPNERRRILEFLLELMTTTRSKEIQARVATLYESVLKGETDFYEALGKRGLIDAEGNLKPEAEAQFVSEMFGRQEGQFRLAQEAARELVASYQEELERAETEQEREAIREKIRSDMEALGARVNVGGYTEVETGEIDVVDRAVRSAGRLQAENIAEEVFNKLEVITNASRREGNGYTMEIFRRNILGSAYNSALETFLTNPTEGSFETFAQTMNAARRKAGLTDAGGFERYSSYIDEKEKAGLAGRFERQALEQFDRQSKEALVQAQRALETARSRTFTEQDREALRQNIGGATVFESLKVKEAADPGFRDRTRERDRAAPRL